MRTWLRAHGTTAAAAVLAFGLTLPYLAMTVELFREVADPTRIDEDRIAGLIRLRAPAGEASTASLLIGVVFAVVTTIALIVTAGLALRRQWAREAGLALFGLLGLVATVLAGAGLAADPPAPGAAFGLTTGLGCLVVAALLLAPATKLDFDQAEVDRRVKKR